MEPPANPARFTATVNLQDRSQWLGSSYSQGAVYGPLTIQGGNFYNQVSTVADPTIIDANVVGTDSFTMGAYRNLAKMEFVKGVSAAQSVVENGSPIGGTSHVQVHERHPAGAWRDPKSQHDASIRRSQ